MLMIVLRIMTIFCMKMWQVIYLTHQAPKAPAGSCKTNMTELTDKHFLLIICSKDYFILCKQMFVCVLCCVDSRHRPPQTLNLGMKVLAQIY